MPAMASPIPKQMASTLLMLTPMSPAVVGSCAGGPDGFAHAGAGQEQSRRPRR